MVTKKKTAKKTVKKEAVAEEVKTPEVETKEEVKEETKEEWLKVIGSLKGGKKVYQKLNTIRFQSARWPISKDKLPGDIRAWLTNKGYWTNVYVMPKEWLEKHNVDPVMLEKLKKFINDNFL